MPEITTSPYAVLLLEVEYTSPQGKHYDYFYCPQVDFGADHFTDGQREGLCGLKAGESALLESGYQRFSYDPGDLKRVPRWQWRPPDILTRTMQPRRGRWYPQGFLSISNDGFPQRTTPLRVTALTDDHIEVDYNHPLAGRDLKVSAFVQRLCESAGQRKEKSVDWLEMMLDNGPGMQIKPAEYEVDYSEPDGLRRADAAADSLFYARPRMVNHLDGQALQHLRQFTASVIDADMKVLDLMSSVESHLTTSPEVFGLGMNNDEMLANPKLSHRIVHDLNHDPHLPYADEEFDAVCCHLSFEYLLHPQTVMRECARVLKKEGRVVLSFSNRWFPGKVIMLWQRLHEFERIGYVSACLREDFGFLRTISYRNWPRPMDDPHYSKLQTSDPLYIVTARKSPAT